MIIWEKKGAKEADSYDEMLGFWLDLVPHTHTGGVINCQVDFTEKWPSQFKFESQMAISWKNCKLFQN